MEESISLLKGIIRSTEGNEKMKIKRKKKNRTHKDDDREEHFVRLTTLHVARKETKAQGSGSRSLLGTEMRKNVPKL